MTDTTQIVGILISIGAICACVLISGGGLPGRRGRTAYHASPETLRTARRALDHYGSYEAMDRAAERRDDGVHVLRMPAERALER